ncbi:hypothetical protein PHYSODRAFT_251156 [Phytophthora sojae]|uniref:Uncharacterized protein n=1 Tax=Phytophthora sojae (strain P6497) TaxID=1094619 RepID=G4YUW6_PHYSP|nr:hypothetical protein PHYSODRAFT_251156 [Phytophthora sojae]EGZ23132.1 hypothetical protein PHYSODRAFT_251156 [Phytophthora sojae]|eukprot:XP_009518420.1 hypothetical protein PHYSODRAFT_251156 [Phytophthora sojae]
MELVAPVVDCTFGLLVLGDPTAVRVYYLVRNQSDTEQVLLLSTSLSAQDYQVAQQFQRGPAAILQLAPINDTQATTLERQLTVTLNYPYVSDPAFAYSELEGIDGDNYWLLKTFPNQHNADPAKTVRMARRFGRYRSDPTAQSNIETAHWDLPTDAATELREWRWYTRAVLHDSWAWTHAIHGAFALNDIFNLSVLAFIIYRRLRMGHVWVGDAFATISNSLLYRGVIVIFCSHLNGYWTITKMCISIGDSITDQHVIYYRPELVHANLWSVYLNLASVLSYLARERVDPLVAYLTFELGWTYRVQLAKLFPALAHAYRDLRSSSPICSPIVFMLAYIIGRKSTRYTSVPVVATGDHVTMTARRRSSAYREGLQQNGLTSFEVATGAALTNRFGVISSYDNYAVHDNQLIATIDAVYCNGFLVVNGKFLIGAQDLLP